MSDTSAHPTPPLAHIEVADREGVRTVAVAGELDISNVVGLEQHVIEIPNSSLGVLIEMTGTAYIDSSTIQVLHRLRRSVARRGQSLAIICPPDSPVRRVLELTGLAPAGEPLHADPAAAEASIRERAAPHPRTG